ncbi:MAG: amino acid transporter [Candidatus Melainabacteria bacterium]|jgi:hypothetical protein
MKNRLLSSIQIDFQKWFFQELRNPQGPMGKAEHTHKWWQVMCLTGVDYFSTLGYQPGIAFIAAGFLSPIATLILVLITLFCALPIYYRVAEQSPDGQGSVSMLEKLFPRWKGKAIVLALLGFAATDFIITITLSAADATAHILENPLIQSLQFIPEIFHNRLFITIILIAALGGVFLKGFKEAIGIAVFLVAVYLSLNFIVVAESLYEIFKHPNLISNWQNNLWQGHSNWLMILGACLLIFPKLALGLSGFETGVAVMPLIEGNTKERIQNTRKLLLTAAVIMSVFLLGSSFATTVLIPAYEFHAGGEANGRALAYLAHLHFGEVFGTVYDVSTISILCFAGASAMAGLLNLVPRYLPRYGMAPEWAKASRPLVVVFIVISFVVTIWFKADVDAQGGAYATGVLMLMTSAAIASCISFWRSKLRFPFILISLVFVYTTVINVIERPEGMKIALLFIALTVFSSLISRSLRATELRISNVILDEAAMKMLEQDQDQIIHVVAHRPGENTIEEYNQKDEQSRELHHLDQQEQLIFIEIGRGDASDFDAPLYVKGIKVGSHNILRASSPAIPNAIAALLIHMGQVTGKLPHAYFGWTEGNPLGYLFRYLFFGEGDVAPIAREVLRQKISDPRKRPYIHVS